MNVASKSHGNVAKLEYLGVAIIKQDYMYSGTENKYRIHW
jgi:hypothetical protein